MQRARVPPTPVQAETTTTSRHPSANAVSSRFQNPPNTLDSQLGAGPIRCRRIAALAPELLTEIFLYRIWGVKGEYATSMGRIQLRAVLGISAVCLTWRRIVLHTPRLWSFQLPIGRNKSSAYADTLRDILGRSSPHPIPIRCDDDSSPAVIRVLLEFVPRWQSMRTDAPELVDLMGAGHSFASLESLVISNFDTSELVARHSFSDVPHLFKLSLHGLKVLNAGNFVPWSRLTQLCLLLCPAETTLAILSQECSSLVKLSIEINVDGLTNDQNSRTQIFPELQSIHLSTYGDITDTENAIGLLFDLIDAPKLGALDVHLLSQDRLLFSSALEAFLHRCPGIHHLTLRNAQLSSHDLSRILRLTPGVTHLCLYYCEGYMAASFWHQLTWWVKLVHKPPPILPQLTSLRLTGAFVDEAALLALGDMACSRWWTNEERAAMTVPPATAQLRKLFIGSDTLISDVLILWKLENALQALKDEGLDFELSVRKYRDYEY